MSDWYEELPFSPSPPRQPAATWSKEAADYLKNPGKWKRLTTTKGPKARERASNLISGINRKNLSAFRTPGHWETARNVLSDTEIEVWVRWLDTADPAPRGNLVPPRRKRTK